ncbi:hypothetical protein F5050DRAFT_870720 [Lentinula boryana]|uniref:Uncharacterized protein n=1 Tax=Lentinula boryana TaxID=40481 RepID=A0ABQ8Q1P3_9AGAR|nr:hypothetical protein F5050DRAFT_870720 [Lentinula boryana]
MQSTRSHIPKAPVYNPYDKFSKNDFDTWIGDITGSLRKVLRQEEEPEPQPQEDKWYYRIGNEEQPQVNGFANKESDSDNSGEEQLDDPFAETRARRVKGKARDPREGPGLAAGTINEPIELESDDEVSGHEDSDHETQLEADDGGESDEEYDDDSREEFREYPSARVNHPSKRSLTPTRRPHTVESDDDDGGDDEKQVFIQVETEEGSEEADMNSDEVDVEDTRYTRLGSYPGDDEVELSDSSLPTSRREISSHEKSPEDDVQEKDEFNDEEQPTMENTGTFLDF